MNAKRCDGKESRRSGALVSRTVRCDQIDASSRDQMLGVFQRYYADTKRAVFERDLANKQHVIILCDSGDHSVQGFSTLEVYDKTVDERRFIAIFSGDTIVDKAYWGQKALQTAFLNFVMGQKLLHPFTPVYWFLISKGYRTYLLLSRNFPEYWPRHDRATPKWQSAIIDSLSRDKYGDAWKAKLGVLKFDHCEGRLKRSVAPIDPQLLSAPDVRFFVDANPGHAKGEELCCIGRVELRLCTDFIVKHLRRAVALPGKKARKSKAHMAP